MSLRHIKQEEKKFGRNSSTLQNGTLLWNNSSASKIILLLISCLFSEPSQSPHEGSMQPAMSHHNIKSALIAPKCACTRDSFFTAHWGTVSLVQDISSGYVLLLLFLRLPKRTLSVPLSPVAQQCRQTMQSHGHIMASSSLISREIENAR